MQFLIRYVRSPTCASVYSHALCPSVVGVVGGVFVCMGYAVKIGTHAVDVITSVEHTNGIIAAESTSTSANLRKRFNAPDLHLRSGKDRVVRQANGWVVEGGSPYGSYANTLVSAI